MDNRKKLEEKMLDGIGNVSLARELLNINDSDYSLIERDLAKNCADVAIQYAIDGLDAVDDACLQELKDYPREKNEDPVEAWERTVWHKIIQRKISELQSLLKQPQP